MLPIIRKQCKELIPSADCNLVQSCLNLTKIFLNKEVINLDNKDKFMFPHKTILTYLSFCLIWSYGANLHDNSRDTFTRHFRNTMREVDSNGDQPDLPEGDLYEYTIDRTYNTF